MFFFYFINLMVLKLDSCTSVEETMVVLYNKAVELNECLKQIKGPISPNKCATIFELPFNRDTMGKPWP